MDTNIYNIEFVEKCPDKLKENTLFLEKREIDTVGTTTGSVWVNVYGENRNGNPALYKPLDYDEPDGAKAELICSHFTKLCLDGISVRTPEINLANENNELGILSYRVHDRTKEDFIHIDSLLHYKFSESDLKKSYTLGLNDLLECIKSEVPDRENYDKLEKAVVMSCCADAFTNNADRHGKNWALVRTKDTNNYDLAVFDNVKSFINMLFNRVGYREDTLWSIGYIGEKTSSNISTGINLVEFIEKNYPEYFKEFFERFNSIRKQFGEDIKEIHGINTQRINSMFSKKSRCFDKSLEMDW